MAGKISVKLRISSAIDNGDGEIEKNDITAEGALEVLDGGYLITYREAVEGGAVLCRIEAVGDTVTVTRQGSVNAVMRFCEGESYSSLYSVGAFSFDMRIFTKKLSYSLSIFGGQMSFLYEMTVGGAPKDCTMNISVTL